MKLKLETGDIFEFKGGGIVGKVIQWKTGSPYTHTGIYVGENTIMEAGATGVVTQPNWYTQNTDWFRYPDLDDTKKKYILRNALKYQGRKYDFFQVFLGLFRNLLWKLPFNSSVKLNCSEFVARVYQDSELPLGDASTNPMWDLDWITPKDIANSKKLRRIEE